LKKLDLISFQGNGLMDEGLQYMAECLKVNASLQELDLSGEPFFLFGFLTDISDNMGVCDEAVKTFMECLKVNTSLQKFVCRYNSATQVGTKCNSSFKIISK